MGRESGFGRLCQEGRFGQRQAPADQQIFQALDDREDFLVPVAALVVERLLFEFDDATRIVERLEHFAPDPIDAADRDELSAAVGSS